MSNYKIKVSKSLLNDLRLQLKSIRMNIKPSYLWEISFGDCDHVLDLCNKWNIDLNGLKVIKINELLFISDIKLLLKHLNNLLDNRFQSFIDVSPELQSPQLLSEQQIKDKKSILNKLFTELNVLSTEEKIIMKSINESISDMCLICGSLLGYPIIYSNSSPQNGNNLSFEPLSHYSVLNESLETIYSFSSPQIFRHLFESEINLWFDLIKSHSNVQNLRLKEEIKTLSLVLT